MKLQLFVLVVAGCGLFKTPTTPAEQAKAALKSGDAWIGHLDSTLSAVDDKDSARSAQSDIDLHFAGLSDGRLCFAIVWDQQLIERTRTADEVAAARLASARAATFAFEARDALDVSPQTTWPDHPANHVQSVEITKNKKTTERHVRSSDNSVWTSENLYTRVELCGPAPKLGSGTKFVTVTWFRPKGDKPPALFVWKLDAPLDSSLVNATPTVAAPTDMKPADPTSPEPTKPSGGTVLEALRADGHYDKFLQIAAAAGKEQDLANGGLIVIAFYDNVLPRSKFDELVADKHRAAALFDDSVIEGTLTKQQLVEKKAVTLTRRNGRTVVLGFDEKSERPTVDGAKLERKIFEGSTWMVLVTSQVTIP